MLHIRCFSIFLIAFDFMLFSTIYMEMLLSDLFIKRKLEFLYTFCMIF